jgi:protein-histidine pros-kinase
MSIKWKINLLLIVIGISTSILISAFNYYEAKNMVFREALKKAEIISSYAMATFKYTKKTMSPLAQKLLGDDVYHPEIEAGFFVTRAISDIFSKSQPGYSFKQACPNPMHIQNVADAQEINIVEFFSENRSVKLKKGVTEKDGEQYFYVAKPVVADKENCIRCHGSREKAPKAVVERYPGPMGYGYTLNEVVATFITYVPIQKALEGVMSMAIRTVLIGIGGVFFIVIAVWFFIGNRVTNPIIRLTQMADEISRGKKINQEIKINATDEIGLLYSSFDRMRVSIIKLVQALKNTKKK